MYPTNSAEEVGQDTLGLVSSESGSTSSGRPPETVGICRYRSGMKPGALGLRSTRLFEQFRARFRCLHHNLQAEKAYRYGVRFFRHWHGRAGIGGDCALPAICQAHGLCTEQAGCRMSFTCCAASKPIAARDHPAKSSGRNHLRNRPSDPQPGLR